MIHLLKISFTIVISILLSVGSAIAYTDLDVKLFNAAQRGNIVKIPVLLGQGADINVRLGADQWTPLMTASREGNIETVELLLQEGAEPNIRDARFKKNAYHWALEKGHHDIARLLLKHGASKELKKPSRFFSSGMSMLAFLVFGILIVLVWIFYFLAVVPFLKANGITPTAFFMNWRFRGELEAYAQLRQAQGKSLTVYQVTKYAYYCIYVVLIFFIITVFKTCQGTQEKSQYEILKDWHDSNLERMLDE